MRWWCKDYISASDDDRVVDCSVSFDDDGDADDDDDDDCAVIGDSGHADDTTDDDGMPTIVEPETSY